MNAHEPKRDREKRPLRKPKITRRTVTALVFALTMLILLVFLVSEAFTVQHVRKIKVSGSTHYTDEELIEYSGIEYGDRLYSIDRKETEKKICDSAPFVKSVKVRRRFFSTASITVTEETPKYFMNVSDEYFLLSDGFKVLEISQSGVEYELAGYVRLALPDVNEIVVGKTLGYKDDEAAKYAAEFMKKITGAEYGSRLTAIGFASRYDLYLVLGGKYKIVLGTTNDLDNKMRAALESIGTFGNNEKCVEVNATDYTEVYCRAVDELTY